MTNQPALGPDTIAVIQENVAIVMTYALSREPLEEYRRTHKGDWKELEYAIFELPRKRANRACIELAVMLRSIDDIYQIRKDLDQLPFGTLHDRAGEGKPLPFREVLNKIIHATSFEWDSTTPWQPSPVIICGAPEQQIDSHGWAKAVVRIDMLATACACIRAEEPVLRNVPQIIWHDDNRGDDPQTPQSDV